MRFSHLVAKAAVADANADKWNSNLCTCSISESHL
jgi:hypothetical protein